MGKIAILFPGQGAQYPGMGKSLYENNEKVKKLFDEAEEYRAGTLNQMFTGTKEELMLTINAQPCIYLADVAAAIALEESGIKADALAGFSLGELAALAIGGAFSPIEGFKIVCERAELMRKASETIDSGMTAVVKLPDAAVEGACAEFDSVYPVNYNSDGQLVVAGKKDSLPAFKERIKELGGKSIDLAVSGGFHSPFMNSAADEFSGTLNKYDMEIPKIPVYANLDAKPYAKNPKELLPHQINNPVRWKEILKAMSESGIDTFIEAGPGKVLSGLVKKCVPGAKIYAADSAETVESVSEVVKNA